MEKLGGEIRKLEKICGKIWWRIKKHNGEIGWQIGKLEKNMGGMMTRLEDLKNLIEKWVAKLED